MLDQRGDDLLDIDKSVLISRSWTTFSIDALLPSTAEIVHEVESNEEVDK